MKWEAVIGLEVHAQLSTQSKIFCSCSAQPRGGGGVGGEQMNRNTCPVCLGHPGVLPVLNRKVVEYAICAGLATHCKINVRSRFARKNYFYPDMPKGYQISQYEEPLCSEGALEIESNGTRKIRIRRIHLEEDAGKNLHYPGYSIVNLNRAGVPLIEIVSEPDLRTPEEAVYYLKSLHSLVRFIGICDGNLQEGNFRCDANVSVRPIGCTELGTRTEIKNINSFRFVEKALTYEIARQIEVLHSGGKIIQETRGYDSAKNVTTSLRSKEEAQDYRYFPEPDLLPLSVSEAWIEELRRKLPELPEEKKKRWMSQYGLTSHDAGMLTSSPEWGSFFEETVNLLSQKKIPDEQGAPKSVANWLTGEVWRLCREAEIEISRAPLSPEQLSELVRLTQNQTLSSSAAKQVLLSLWGFSANPSEVLSVEQWVERLGLRQISDDDSLLPAIESVIASFPGPVAEFQSGKEKVLGFLVGQVMKKMSGKANPARIQQLLRERLSQSRSEESS